MDTQEEKNNESQKATEDNNSSEPATKSSSGTGLVIGVIVLLLIVLGVGGYLILSYLGKKDVEKTAGTMASVTVTATAGASLVASSTATTASVSDYVIDDSGTRVILRSELVDLTPWQLKVARNEIYARQGREFVHKDLQCYFAKKTWYKVDANYSESSLSTTENKNIATIQAYEEETNSPLASEDSGCNTNQ